MRVVSGTQAKIFFPKPIYEEITPPRPTTRRDIIYTYSEVQAIARELQRAGFGERAIVALRERFEVTKAPNVFQMAKPANWGVVLDLRTTVGFNQLVYFPLKIQWIKDGSVSDHWEDDLILIHPSITFNDVEAKAKEQMT